MACIETKKCVIKDNTTEVMEKVRTADVLVFATPIYYYAICGQLKTFLDRMNPIYSAGHNFKEGKKYQYRLHRLYNKIRLLLGSV